MLIKIYESSTERKKKFKIGNRLISHSVIRFNCNQLTLWEDAAYRFYCYCQVGFLLSHNLVYPSFSVKPPATSIRLSLPNTTLNLPIVFPWFVHLFIIIWFISMVLCRTPKQYKHLIRILLTQLVEHERILTSRAKVKNGRYLGSSSEEERWETTQDREESWSRSFRS